MAKKTAVDAAEQTAAPATHATYTGSHPSVGIDGVADFPRGVAQGPLAPEVLAMLAKNPDFVVGPAPAAEPEAPAATQQEDGSAASAAGEATQS